MHPVVVSHNLFIYLRNASKDISQPNCNRERQEIKPLKASEPSTGGSCGKVETVYSADNE